MSDMSANEIHIEIPEGAKVYATYSLLEVIEGDDGSLMPTIVSREHQIVQEDLTKIRIVTANGV